MKFVKFFLLSFFILIGGLAFSQQTTKKATEIQSKKTTAQQNTQKKNDIKTVPKSKLQQSQLKKINQNKSKLQTQKLKKAIRRNNIKRKPNRK